MRKIIIAPSILSADFSRLGAEVDEVLASGAEMIHFDVMDNHYVPNLTFGPMICDALRNYGIKAPIDVHLMTAPVDGLITAFANAGATYISFHPEASSHIDRSLQLIQNSGCKAGLAFNPATSLDYLDYVWDKLDLILLMSVNPGFGGQQFIPSVLSKINQARSLVDQYSCNCSKTPPLLEVDGGVNLDNVKVLAKSGVDILVAGSAIFNHRGQYKEIINKMKKLAAHEDD